jgi:hypothetical protein
VVTLYGDVLANVEAQQLLAGLCLKPEGQKAVDVGMLKLDQRKSLEFKLSPRNALLAKK